MEVAIFEALRFEADFGRAALLAVVQIGVMSSLLVLAFPLLKPRPEIAVVGRAVPRYQDLKAKGATPEKPGVWRAITSS